MKKFLYVLPLAIAACQGVAPVQPYPHSIGYVSASPAADETAYVSAMEEAQAEWDAQTDPAAEVEVIEHLQAQQVDDSWADSTTLWGRPPASTEDGKTLLDESLRQRLNDALQTTPLGGSAKWQEQNLTFEYRPNSPVYKPHFSGGRCRDGVFAIYGDGFTDQRFRGLFCQSGPGADWLLLMQN